MTRRNAAIYLGVKRKTLAMWAFQGKGPPSVKVGGRRFYYLEELEAWVHDEIRQRRPGFGVEHDDPRP